MRLRRCQHLMVELDQQPRFSFEGLLAGGDGLDRSPRWLAFAAHLDTPVAVTLPQLAVLAQVDREAWTERASLEASHGVETVEALLQAGLLLPEQGDPSRQARDEAVREVEWWTPALVAHVHGGWQGLDIEARTERGLMLSSQQMVDEFGAAPPPAHVRGDGAPRLPLPGGEGTAFDELLAARRTCRNFDPEAVLDAAAFATMMRRVWGAVGTRTLAPGAVAVKKTSPAGGGMHAIEAYVLARRVEGIAPGFYHYLAMEHALEPVQPLTDAEAGDWAHRFVAGQHWFTDVPVMVVMVARFDRLFWKYRRHAKAWRVLHLDAGHLSQTMYLSATELGLGCFVTAAINDRDIERALALPPLREGAIALVGFGPRAAEVKTLELDVFDPVRPPHLAGA